MARYCVVTASQLMRIGKRLRNDGAHIGFIADGCRYEEEFPVQFTHSEKQAMLYINNLKALDALHGMLFKE